MRLKLFFGLFLVFFLCHSGQIFAQNRRYKILDSSGTTDLQLRLRSEIATGSFVPKNIPRDFSRFLEKSDLIFKAFVERNQRIEKKHFFEYPANEGAVDSEKSTSTGIEGSFEMKNRLTTEFMERSKPSVASASKSRIAGKNLE